MPEVVSPRVFTGLGVHRIGTGRHRKSKSPCRQSFGDSFESDNREAVRQTEEGTDSSTKGMADDPYVGISIDLSDVGV